MVKPIHAPLLFTLMTAASASLPAAGLNVFLNPSVFSANATLVTFDDLGLAVPSQFTSGDGVGFLLLQQGTLVSTGFGPTLASAPNSTYSREFPPQDGPLFLNMINFNAFNVDLEIDFPTLVWKAGAEIRSGPSPNSAQNLTFELYRAGALIAQTTLSDRGLDNFFFYGIQSDAGGFDKLVIRQSPDYRFDLDNLQFDPVPEPPAGLWTASAAAALIALTRRLIRPFSDRAKNRG